MRPSANTKLDTFNPQTPSEMVLWNEIKRLRTEIYVLERSNGIFPVGYEALVTVDMPEISPILRMPAVADLRANIDAQGRLAVEARAYGKDGKLGFAYYVDPRDAPDRIAAADILMHLHQTNLQEMARLLVEPVDAR